MHWTNGQDSADHLPGPAGEGEDSGGGDDIRRRGGKEVGPPALHHRHSRAGQAPQDGDQAAGPVCRMS